VVGHELAILGMNGSQPAEADRFIEPESHVFKARPVDVFDESGRGGDEDDLRHRIGKRPIPCLAFTQGGFCGDASYALADASLLVRPSAVFSAGLPLRQLRSQRSVFLQQLVV
jgi:hypothetical protein